MHNRQRGAALILMFLALILVALSVFVLRYSPQQRDAETLQREHQSLHAAKQLLLAYAARRHGRESDSPAEDRELQLARPGELVCPDFNNDRQMNGPTNDYNGAHCRHRVGWFVFESFNHESVIGDEASPIWYAVAAEYYNYSGLGGYNEPVINTVTNSSMTLDGEPVVAVLFATGLPLEGQNDRGVDDAAAAQSSFLEQDNAATQDTFISLSASANFNDVALGITQAELMQAVEKKAAFAIAKRLNQYFVDNNRYPAPSSGSGSCDMGAVPAAGDVPEQCVAFVAGADSLAFPPANATDAEDVWLVRNDWLAQFGYERLALNRMRITSRYGETALSPLTFSDGQLERPQ